MSRVPRQEAVQGERRRRRNTLDPMQDMRLSLPPEFRDDDKFHYRWVNDENNKVYHLSHNDDYDPCTLKDAATSEEQDVRRYVGKDAQGNPLYAVLMRKPMEYVREDQKAMDESLREQEAAITRKPDTTDAEARDLRERSYVPSGTSIKHSNYTP